MKAHILIICSLFSLSLLQAQIEGDNIFQEDQIIDIQLNFSQTGFWDSLTANYATTTYMKADLILTDLTGEYEFEDVGVRLKGNSSYGHPGNKKSMKIDFNEYVSGQNYDGLKKLNFSNGFKDPSLMREKIFFDVCRAANVPAPRSNFANITINGTAWGFYTVIEQIDDQFLDWKILDDDGNLFKAGDNFGGGPGGGGDEADLIYYGDDQSAYEDLYELKSNEEENDWTDLIEFIDFINNGSATDFEDGLGDRLELQEYLRSVALDNLFGNLDSYLNSARNYYLYHNETTDKWQWIKWDGNETFGTYTGGPGLNNITSLALDYHSNNRPLLENVFDSEILYSAYELEVCYLLNNFFNPEYLHPKIDAIKDMIAPSVYADNNKMYSDANFDTNVESNLSTGGGGGPGGGTVYGLKSFIEDRYSYADGQLDCIDVANENLLRSVNFSAYPNPFSNILTLEWDQELIGNLEVYDLLGRKVYVNNLGENKRLQVDLSFLAAGSYYVRMVSSEFNGLDSPVLSLIKM